MTKNEQTATGVN